MPKTKIGKEIRTELGLLGKESALKVLDNGEIVLFGIQQREDGQYVYLEVKIKDKEVIAVVKSNLLTKPAAQYKFRIETGKRVLK